MNHKVTTNRTDRLRWNLYDPDGRGRDTYILNDNGGFWKNFPKIKYKPSYPIYHKTNYHSLYHLPAPFHYIPDGSGRDAHILSNDGGLRRNFKALDTYSLGDYLRDGQSGVQNYTFQPKKTKNNPYVFTQNFLGEKEKMKKKYLDKLQSGIINRLYKPFIPKLRELTLKEKKKRKQNEEDEKTFNYEELTKKFSLMNGRPKSSINNNIKKRNNKDPFFNFTKTNSKFYYMDENTPELPDDVGIIPFLREYPNEICTIKDDPKLLTVPSNKYKNFPPEPILPKPRFFKKRPEFMKNIDY